MRQTQSSTAAPAGHWVVERPPPGLARGTHAWPPWAIALAGGLVLAAALAVVLLRWRRSR